MAVRLLGEVRAASNELPIEVLVTGTPVLLRCHLGTEPPLRLISELPSRAGVFTWQGSPLEQSWETGRPLLQLPICLLCPA